MFKQGTGFFMSVFGAYSRYYDLLYKDKDYDGEAAYVYELIRRHHPQTKSVLDLGCGSGRHALLLAEKGLEVAGVDRSEEMLAVAKSHYSTHISQKQISFHQGDIRSIRLSRAFDTVVCLFHVMNYQTTDDDLLAAFATVRDHLAPDGFFIFDSWYGPAVLTERPEVRVKRLEDDDISVTRIAEPVMYPNENRVDVHYNVFVRKKKSGAIEELHEKHCMRYLFRPEIELLLKKTGMTLVEASGWMTGLPPGFDTWGVCFVAKKDSDES